MAEPAHRHLLRAWQTLRRSTWPDLADCLLDPIRSRLIRARAHQLAHQEAQQQNRPQPAAHIDRKRLAAGDIDHPDD